MAATAKTKALRHKRLLRDGFLPLELPPPFVSEDLARYQASLGRLFHSLPDKKGEPWHLRYQSSPSSIFYPNHGKQDRRLHILNPISFFHISNEIAENWVQLRKKLRNNSISASLPVFNWQDGRALVSLDFTTHDAKRAAIYVRHSYVVNSDIQRFYASLYTHAIAWAVEGKTTAKRNRGMNLLGNRLDRLTRNAQDGQTIGIPVGPDTSRIIAEIVSAAIDTEMHKLNGVKQTDSTRFVDDYLLGADSSQDASKLLFSLRKAVQTYELELNEEKTSIRDALRLDYSSWRREIRKWRPWSTGSIEEFGQFFDRINQTSLINPKENIQLYALKTIRSRAVHARNAWSMIEDYLLILYRSNPSTLPTTIAILVNRHRIAPASVDLEKIGRFISSNIERLSETGKSGELVWLLYLAAELTIEVRASQLEGVFSQGPAAVALVICHLEAIGLVRGKVRKSDWNSSLDGDGIKSEMWLYAYEASLKGWTSSTRGTFIQTDEYFQHLYARRISFYNINRRIPGLGEITRSDFLSAAMARQANSPDAADLDLDFDLDEPPAQPDDNVGYGVLPF